MLSDAIKIPSRFSQEESLTEVSQDARVPSAMILAASFSEMFDRNTLLFISVKMAEPTVE